MSSTTEVAAPTSDRFIGFSVRFISGNAWLATLAKGARAEARKLGHEVEAVDAQGDAGRQVAQMQAFIRKGARAIIIEPVDDRAVAPGIEACAEAGVPLVVVNDRVAPELAKKAYCNVHDDGFRTCEMVGALMAEAVASRFSPHETIKLYIQAIFPQEPVTETRERGFLKGYFGYFAARQGPRTLRVPNRYGHALPDRTLTAMRDTLAAHPDVNVIFNQTDVVEGAVERALTEAGLMNPGATSGKVVIASFDGGMDVIKSMVEKPGYPVVADGLNQPLAQGALAVQQAVRAAEAGGSAGCSGSPPTLVLPSIVVTPETAHKFVDHSVPFAQGGK